MRTLGKVTFKKTVGGMTGRILPLPLTLTWTHNILFIDVTANKEKKLHPKQKPPPSTFPGLLQHPIQSRRFSFQIYWCNYFHRYFNWREIAAIFRSFKTWKEHLMRTSIQAEVFVTFSTIMRSRARPTKKQRSAAITKINSVSNTKSQI